MENKENSRYSTARIVGALLGTGLLIFALAVIHHELKVLHYRDLIRQLFVFPANALVFAGVLTSINYLFLCAYDSLAFRWIGQQLRIWQVGLTSFIAYVFSYNVGLSVFGGAAIRYRMYSAWGISAGDIARVVAFNVVTLWLGFFAVAGSIFLYDPVSVQKHISLPFLTVRPLGLVFLSLVALYLLWSLLKRDAIHIWKWRLTVPSFKYALTQIAVSGFDWILSGSVLFVLMPSSFRFGFFSLMAVFLLAQFAGLVSHVPGGIGVFEGVVLFFFSEKLPSDQLMTSLIAYRVVYYFIPFVAATAFLLIHELASKRSILKKGVAMADKWIWGFVPEILAVSTFLSGSILLFSGASPAVAHRMAWLKGVLPLAVIEISHFFGSIVGVFLLFLAWGLHRRLNAARFLTILVLVSGIGLSLLKGIDYEEALILSISLVALVTAKKYFYRKTSLLNERFTWGWFFAIAVILVLSLWLGFFSFKHVEYSEDLWWKFEFSAEASRFLRASVGAIVVLLMIAFSRLLRPPRLKGRELGIFDLSQIKAVINRSSRTSANLALLGDKRFLFSDSGSTFLMFGVEGRSWIALGDPVGPEEEWPDLVWRFRELCDEHNSWPVFYQVGHANLYLYVDLGLTLHKIGEEARVFLPQFSLAGSARKGLRYTLNKHEKAGWIVRIVPASELPTFLKELQNISDIWLREKKTREKGFSLGNFDQSYLRHFSVAIALLEEHPAAFATLWLTRGKEELSVDLMRYLPEASKSIMEYLFISLMLWGQNEGYQWFNLGMAPLFGLQNRPLSSLWNKVGSFIYRNGEDFYNFEGLRQFKEKFDPEWEPRYVACPAGLRLPRILTNIATLISGGFKGVWAK